MEDKRYFEKLIESELLENLHRIEVTLEPDTEFDEKQEKKLDDYLCDLAKRFDARDYAEVGDNETKLAELQSRADDPEVLPFLPISEISETTEFASPTIRKDKYTFYGIDTNDLAYFQGFFPLPELTRDERLLLPLLCSLMNKSGTVNFSYEQQSIELDLYTGGIGFDVSSYPLHENAAEHLEMGTISGKALMKNLDKLMGLSEELVLRNNFEDTDRIENLIKQRQAAMYNSISHRGHAIANLISQRNFHQLLNLGELSGGISQVKYTNELATGGKLAVEAQTSAIKELYGKIFRKGCIEWLFMGPDRYTDRIESFMGKFGKTVTDGSGSKFVRKTDQMENRFLNEVWLMPSPVSYVAASYPTPNYEHGDSIALELLANILQSKYIHPEIREKGGAYGGKVAYNSSLGAFSFMSYRDPNYARTLQVYEGSASWLKNTKLTERDLEEAKLGIFQKLDSPLSPQGEASKNHFRSLMRVPKENILNRRRQFLNAKLSDVYTVMEKYIEHAQYSSATITSEQILNDSMDDLVNRPTVNKIV